MAKKKQEGVVPPPPPPPKRSIEEDFMRVVTGEGAPGDITKLQQQLGEERKLREEAERREQEQKGYFEAIIEDLRNEIERLKHERSEGTASYEATIQKLEARVKELEDEATLDYLTGLRRRKNFLYEANSLLRSVIKDRTRSRKHGDERRETSGSWPNNATDLTVIMLDLDDFKAVNDTHGHDAGDEVLRTAANTMKSTLREEGDLIGRWGGEEMIVCIRNSPGGGIAAAERIRRALEDINITKNRARIPVTASIGFAKWQEGESLNDVIAHADEAMYKAKGAGKNRVWPYGGVEGVSEPLPPSRQGEREES
jgi:diguanylate cyclase (GGDEF)-like protein